ncbi:MAG TPA: GntR family transcriptional regulator [Thermoanaerobaculia bacterium]|nr:GntR family transcriptional regulator [Thermoanaerobaculia bacterium]
MASPPFRLDPSSGVPFYRQVIDQVLLAVADGRLKPGAQLPTVRALAVELSVNLNTIARAYREMEIRGIVETQQGTGTFVSARRPERKAADRRRALERLVDQFLTTAASQGFTTDEFAEALLVKTEDAGRR